MGGTASRSRPTRVIFHAITWRLATAALLGLCAGACTGGARRQAILVLLDAARADRLSVYGHPGTTSPCLDRLSRTGALYEQAFAQGTETRRSLPAILYSRYFSVPIFPASASVRLEDPADLFRTADSERISIPRALHRAGFATAAISAHSWIRSGTSFAAEFDEIQDLSQELRVGKGEGYPHGPEVVSEVGKWLRARRSGSFFLYLHLMDTHLPHFLDTEARLFYGDGEYQGAILPGGRPRDPRSRLQDSDRRYLDALYDGGVQRADRAVGLLLREAHRTRVDPVILVTADHGEHLLEVPGRFGHGREWYDAVAHVPLILSAPRQVAPALVPYLVESVDIAPTLLALLDVVLPPGKSFDGRDLRDGASRDVAVCAAGIRSERYKALFAGPPAEVLGASGRAAAIRMSLFDLVRDPLETRDVLALFPRPGAAAFLAAYRGRLAVSFRRYQNATTRDPPVEAFAIGADRFRTEPPLAATPAPESLYELAATASWYRIEDWSRFALVALPGASPLAVEIPIPSGTYEVSVHLRGACTVGFPGQGDVRVAAAPVAPERWPVTDEKLLGKVTVADATFRMTIRPEGQGPTVLRILGFHPGGKVLVETDREREERLRALGYLD